MAKLISNYTLLLFLLTTTPISLRAFSLSSQFNPSLIGRDASISGSLGSSSASVSSDALNQVTLMDLIRLGLSPANSATNYLMPNTYNGLRADLTNSVSALNSGASSGLSSLQGMLNSGTSSGLSSLQGMLGSAGEGLNKNYASLSQSLDRRLMSSEEILRRLYAMVSEPEQMCRQLANQTKSTLNQASQQVEQMTGQNLSRMPQSLMEKFSSSSFPFAGR